MKIEELKHELKKLGLKRNMKIMVHVSLSKIGRLDDGPAELIRALEDIVSEEGIIVMPAYKNYGDYKPVLSIVNDAFKTMPDVICTNQLTASFAVWGNKKTDIAGFIEYTEDGLSFENGEKSTVARLYKNGGWSLFLGTDYSTCTMLHLAENRAVWPSKIIFTEEYVSPEGLKILYHDVAYQDEDFNEIGKAFEICFKDNPKIIKFGRIGNADCKLINQKKLVDYAVEWMKNNRQ